MLLVSQLIVYPIKSLGGIGLQNARVTDRGLEHDRRWMLIDANNRFLSQREHAQLALFSIIILDTGLEVTCRSDGAALLIPFVPQTKQMIDVSIWDDTCPGQIVSNEANEWFSKKAGMDCRLVYMPDDVHRQTDSRYTDADGITSFSDAYPALLIGQASLDDLNSRLAEALPMNRFRPNIVFTGGDPYSEDIMNHISINGADMYGVKLCARCVLTTIDQDTATKGKEPLKTLSQYRRKGAKILFGQNLMMTAGGTISVGDELQVHTTHTEERFIVGPQITEA
ncbi:MOSC domain-containing protein [Mucilaginibacter pallidiroseus]|uniref:MOSC domain-containing protein n=1 Tax=Mucilaginibacter pallidiroseus TaxID=2599295 RepID=A0A563UIA9_9SPHI|nr:MOSC N-terminal beta barrel domain-containing protein [Mucilaginibacter pallidiroseus]TWR31071.1 MOSC domain-containing protein [Mucilaginibacter pallidiroseus]